MQTTLVHALHAQRISNKIIGFYNELDSSEVISYADLWVRATGFATMLAQTGVSRKDQMVLLLEDKRNRDFVIAFWGCLIAGVIPVPLSAGAADEYKRKFFQVWDQLESPWLYSSSQNLARLEESSEDSLRATALRERSILVDSIDIPDGTSENISFPDPLDPAFIQFSSGSTGSPKGVLLNHANLMDNIQSLHRGFDVRNEDRFLSWAPLTHDMGLIALHILPLIADVDQALMPTQLFVRRPHYWLELAHQLKSTISFSPNFGYKHFLRLYRPERAAHWDLSGMRMLINAAEPISVPLAREFQHKLAAHGLDERALTPGYGLAEATVGVCMQEPGMAWQVARIAPDSLVSGASVQQISASDSYFAVEYPSVGPPLPGVRVRIGDGTGRSYPERVLGDIEVNSAAVANSYYRNSDASSRLFTPDNWLITGDLGFLDHGRLTIVGRTKELIILGGQNIFPHDIERVAEELPSMEIGKVVACGLWSEAQQQEILGMFLYHKAERAAFETDAHQLHDHILRRTGIKPSVIVAVRRIPKTTSGKIQRFVLRREYEQGSYADQCIQFDHTAGTTRIPSEVGPPDAPGIQHELMSMLAQITGRQLRPDLPLMDQSVSSLQLITLEQHIERHWKLRLDAADVFDYPDIIQLARHMSALLCSDTQQLQLTPSASASAPSDRIAIIGMGCRFPGALNLCEYWNLVLRGSEALGALPSRPGLRSDEPNVPAAGHFLPEDALEYFDAEFFGISPREAAAMDPQQRLLLEVTQETLEQAAISAEKIRGTSVGVFIGMSTTDFAQLQLAPDRPLDAYSLTGSGISTAAGRIAYCYDWQGPAMAIDTACSSSLVALHQAARSIARGECHMALAGGVNLMLSASTHRALHAMGALSPDGQSRAFCEDANGYGRGEGCGLLLLTSEHAARRDGNRILGFLRPGALNHDGRSNGLTVPNSRAQQQLLRLALQSEQLGPDQVDAIEAHGTGTPLGDPIEARALDQVFGTRTIPLWLSSAKSNVGHLESAAGVAGVIRALLELYHGTHAPHPGADRPNPRIDWNGTCLKLPTEPRYWERGSDRRRIGVSAFGFSGTNAHLILEEPDSLTLDQPVVWMFTGQGSQYPGMGKVLFESHPVFREQIRQCDAILADMGAPAVSRQLWGDLSEKLSDTEHTQPALFCLEYAMAQALRSEGQQPDIVLGHSIGEITAAAQAEVMSLEDALHLVVRRGRLMGALPPGAMVAIHATLPQVRSLLEDCAETLDLAASNAPLSQVVSGSIRAIQALCALLDQHRIAWRSLDVSHAFHSNMMDPMLQEFRAALSGVHFGCPSVALISNTSAAPMDTAMNADYWVRHVRAPVHFCQSIEFLLEQNPLYRFVELGPQAILSSLVRKIGRAQGLHIVPEAPLQPGSNARDHWHHSLAQLRRITAGRPDILQVSAQLHHRQNMQHYPLPAATTHCPAPLENPDQSQETPMNTSSAPSILAQLRNIFRELSGLSDRMLHDDRNIFEMGIDSLMVGQAQQEIQRRFGIQIPLSEFYDNASTLAGIARMIPNQDALPADPEAHPAAPAATDSGMAAPAGPPVTESSLERLAALQLQTLTGFMQDQMRQLTGMSGTSTTPAAPDAPRPASTTAANLPSTLNTRVEVPAHLTDKQRAFLRRFVEDYAARTSQSRAHAEHSHQGTADWIHSINYCRELATIQYPIVATRAHGAEFEDLDGNRYIDLSMGYGSAFLGHSPPAVDAAIRQQLDTGFALGPQTSLAGDVSALIRHMTGVERVCFANTGTEAIMAALRVARAVSGKQLVVMFATAYHGTFDGILAQDLDGQTQPTSPGTPPGMVADIKVLPYGEPKSLEQLDLLMPQLAAVLIEPVQSRRPGYQPREFVREVRKRTANAQVALILDEIITGFRSHNGGIQALWDIDADMLTYGKALSGGMPIAVIAGKARYLDAIDGGVFDEHTEPSDQRVIFGGTFVKHPLALQAARAVLTHLKDQNGAVQEDVNQRMERLAKRMNRLFALRQVPLEVRFFTSLFRLEGIRHYAGLRQPFDLHLFYALMMHAGLYIWERRVCFLSAAHTDADCNEILQRVEHCILHLRRGGYDFALPEILYTAPEADSAPLLPTQRGIWGFLQARPGSTTYNQPGALHLQGHLSADDIRLALLTLTERHQALRCICTLDSDGEPRLQEADGFALPFRSRQASADQQTELLQTFLQPFDIQNGPLWRAELIQIAPNEHLLLLDLHHLIADGLSLTLLVVELGQLVRQEQLEPAGLPCLSAQRIMVAERQASERRARRAEYWQQRLHEIKPQQLPADFADPDPLDNRGSYLDVRLEPHMRDLVLSTCRSHGVSPFALLLGTWALALKHWDQTADRVIGIPVANRQLAQTRTSMGMYASTLPFRVPISSKNLLDWIRQIQRLILADMEWQDCSLEEMLELTSLRARPGENPLYRTLFNYEQAEGRGLSWGDVDCTEIPYPHTMVVSDLVLEIVSEASGLRLRLGYSCNRFEDQSMQALLQGFTRILQQALEAQLHLSPASLSWSGPVQAAHVPQQHQRPSAPPSQDNDDTQKSAERQHIVERMRHLWENILGHRPEPHQSFFDLGGHSLRAVRLVNSLQQEFGVRVDIRDVFRYHQFDTLVSRVRSLHSAGAQTALPALQRAPERQCFALSHEQMRLWLLQQINPESLDYNRIFALHLQGRVDEAALQQALCEIVDQHPMLRTRFITRESRPLQEVLEQVTADVQIIDLSESGGYAAAMKHLGELVLQPFALDRYPLLHFRIYRLGNNAYLLGIVEHHIIWDGWSNAIIAQELAQRYKALAARETRSTLPESEWQYADYVTWQQAYLRSSAARHSREYWYQRLADMPDPIDLVPPDTRPQMRNQHAGLFWFDLGQNLDQSAFEQFCAELRITPFMALCGMLGLLLHEQTSQSDILIGTPVANRPLQEFEQIVGFFLNMLPLRMYIDPNQITREFFSGLRNHIQADLMHQSYPFDLLIEDIGIQSPPNRHPAFDVMLMLHNNESLIPHFEGLRTREIEDVPALSRLDLNLEVFPTPSGMRVKAEYDPALFSQDDIARLADRLNQIHRNSIESQHLKIEELIRQSGRNLDNTSLDAQDSFLQNTRNIDEDF